MTTIDEETKARWKKSYDRLARFETDVMMTYYQCQVLGETTDDEDLLHFNLPELDPADFTWSGYTMWWDLPIQGYGQYKSDPIFFDNCYEEEGFHQTDGIQYTMRSGHLHYLIRPDIGQHSLPREEWGDAIGWIRTKNAPTHINWYTKEVR